MMQLKVKWHPQSREEVEQVVDDWMSEPRTENSWAGVMYKNDGSQHKFDVAKCRDTVNVQGGTLPQSRWSEEDLRRGWELVSERVEQLIRQAKESRTPDAETE
ncbi:hypothetical protein GBA63_02230 [Rubrobacter tropicus]|uniref:Uncharacterized protein n=1 Tax=Rubrobacter tropicus TaxID=2653851 RepID=A0A6G8Q525_9ACTN|nr:hypothetical protein [Rubrobacter tropicus]QIN81575.1 hypothetical protein GBA63_02230 [Rubrobacter tropicus]